MRTLFCYCIFSVLCDFIELVRHHDSNPIVKTAKGFILGRKLKTPLGKDFFAFEGIPYAAPPIGRLRFASPQQLHRWSGVKKCINSNIMCVQFGGTNSKFETEDCLILNTFTPQLRRSSCESGFPVMVYFHNGGYLEGNTTYDSLGPEYLIQFNVIVVTVNYRLGPLGFLSTGDVDIPGNFGLQDQQLALQWVRKNIMVFGGDPGKVTIFGVSAGASSVGFHLMNDKSKGLFRAAILGSGAPISSWATQMNPRKIAFLTAQYVDDSRTPENSRELLEMLRKAPISSLKNATLRVLSQDPYVMDQAISGYYYGPVLDFYAKNGFLKKHPYEAFEKGHFNRVPLMVGRVSEEALFLVNEMDALNTVLKQFEDEGKVLVSEHFSLEDEEEENIGKLIYDIYTEGGERSLMTNIDKGVKYFSDQCFNNGVIKLAHLSSRFTDVFVYRFSYDGTMGNFTADLNGAGSVSHLEDLNYIWRRNLTACKNMVVDDFPAENIKVQRMLLKLYTNFAKYLNPTPSESPDLDNIMWPPVNPALQDEIEYLDIDAQLEVKTDPELRTYTKYNEIFLKYAKRPYDCF